MKTIELNPDQLITLNDYPLYSNEVLSHYIAQCMDGNTLPMVPVISVETVQQHFDAELSQILDAFLVEHPAAAYFILDGSHRTTALTLTNHPIRAIIYETDADIVEARGLVATGQVLQNATLDMTQAENCAVLNQHFCEKPFFMTVRQKTARLVADGHISSHILGEWL